MDSKKIIEIRMDQDVPLSVRDNVSQTIANNYPGYTVALSILQNNDTIYTTIVYPRQLDKNEQTERIKRMIRTITESRENETH